MSLFNNISNALGKCFGIVSKEGPLSNKNSYAMQATVKGGDKFITVATLVTGVVLAGSAFMKIFGVGSDSNNNHGGHSRNNPENRRYNVRDNARFDRR